LKTFNCKNAGIEVSSALTGKAKSVTVVDMSEVPFEMALGKQVGGAVKKVIVNCI
jgi:hypothetical protein